MIIQTLKFPWYVLRTGIASAAYAITAFSHSDWPSSDVVNLGEPAYRDMTNIILAAYGKDAENEDVAYRLYGRRKMNGPILLLAEGVITLGSQACAKDPISGDTITGYTWADTITLTGGWLDQDETIMDSGGNRICGLRLDIWGIQDLYLDVDSDGGSAEAAEINVIFTGG